ncbi:MAG: GyrI-like domain-containing protein [Planctomycetota bacterium]
MRAKTIGLLCALAFATDAAAQTAEVTDSARAILERAMEAMGGEAALSGFKGLRRKGSGTYKDARMEMAFPYVAETVFMPPDRFLWVMTSGGMTMRSGIHGGEAWSEMMATPAARVAGAMRAHYDDWLVLHQVVMIRPLLYMEGAKITGGETTDEDGRTVHRVRMELTNGKKYVLTFAEDRGFHLVAFEADVTHWDGRKGVVRQKLSKPTQFGAMTFMAQMESRNYVDGELLETVIEEIQSVEWNPEIPADACKMPELKIPLMVPSRKTSLPASGVMIVHKGDYRRMGETIKKAMGIVQEAGLMQFGAVIAVYLNDPDKVKAPAELRTEIVVPVMLMGPPPKLPEGVIMRELKATPVACMTARGPYGKADVEALTALLAWVEEKGHEVGGNIRTLYRHHPEMTLAEDMISEVQIPIRTEK